MPAIQTIDLSPQRKESGLDAVLGSFAKKQNENMIEEQDTDALRDIYEQYQRDGSTLEEHYAKTQQDPRLSPTTKINSLKHIKEMMTHNHELQKEAIKAANKGTSYQTEEDREAVIDNAMDNGMPYHEAVAYADAKPGVQQRIWAHNIDQVERGFRKPKQKLAPQQQLAEQDIATKEGAVAGEEKTIAEAEQDVAAAEKAEAPTLDAEGWPIIPSPTGKTPKELSKRADDNLKENTKELKVYNGKTKNNRDTGILIDSMTRTSKFLPKGIKSMLIDPQTGDIYDEAKVAGFGGPPEARLYAKNLKQFMRGAKEQFGARVTNFDASIFLQQLPSMLEDESSRELILQQMRLSNELDEVYNKEMADALRHYGENASFIDIDKVVTERVKAKEADKIAKLNNVVDGAKYMVNKNKDPKLKDTTLMYRDGKFKYVTPADMEKARTAKWSTF